MTLHFGQIFFTDGLTFMTSLSTGFLGSTKILPEQEALALFLHAVNARHGFLQGRSNIWGPPGRIATQCSKWAARLLSRVTAGTCRIRWDAEVPRAFDVLALRTVGDLGQMLDRRRSAGSIAHIEAVMLAMTGLLQAPAPAPKPRIVTL